jgi:hypothetical protein
MKILITAFLLMLSAAAAASAQTTSVYTSLKAKDCRTIESTDEEGGSYRGICRGSGAYRLELLEGDLRQTINVIAPNKKKFELELWSNVSGGFSSIGEKAEWRLRGGRPVALILRYNVSESTEDASRTTSYLVVAKITAAASCVTDVVKQGKDQNARARRLADAAAASPCVVRE